MKSLLFFIIMLSVPLLSHPMERKKPVHCFQLNEILHNLKTNYGEKLDYVIDNQMYANFVTKIAMYRNEQTGSWTLIEYGDTFEGEGCIIASGKHTTS